MFVKILQNLQENTCVGFSLLIKLYYKKAPTQIFSCEFCKIFKKIYVAEHVLALLMSLSLPLFIDLLFPCFILAFFLLIKLCGSLYYHDCILVYIFFYYSFHLQVFRAIPDR